MCMLSGQENGGRTPHITGAIGESTPIDPPHTLRNWCLNSIAFQLPF